MSSKMVEGTHQGRPRPRGGYVNTCIEGKGPGKKVRKVQARLKARIESFEGRNQCKATHGYNKPGSLQTSR